MNPLEALENTGYYAPRRLQLAVLSLLNHCSDSVPALLLEGEAGVGKTALGESLAKGLGIPSIYHMLHAWSDSDELHVGIDVAAAVGRQADEVRQMGILAQAAILSHEGLVVLILDEIDKTSERCEALLLDFLQNGRVPVSPADYVTATKKNVLVFITSNGMREMSDALLRRVRRVQVEQLPTEVINGLVEAKSGVPKSIVTLVSKASRVTSNVCISMQEIENACSECFRLALSHEDVVEIMMSWLARDPQGIQALKSSKISNAVWAEIKKARMMELENV